MRESEPVGGFPFKRTARAPTEALRSKKGMAHSVCVGRKERINKALHCKHGPRGSANTRSQAAAESRGGPRPLSRPRA